MDSNSIQHLISLLSNTNLCRPDPFRWWPTGHIQPRSNLRVVQPRIPPEVQKRIEKNTFGKPSENPTKIYTVAQTMNAPLNPHTIQPTIQCVVVGSCGSSL